MILYLYSENYKTIVVEDIGEFRSTQTVKEIINSFCLVYGSTIEGRREALSLRLQIVQMVPILISEKTMQMLFPIVNGTKNNWWIHFQAILEIHKLADDKCMIEFINHQTIILHVNHRSLKRQMHRCELYKKILLLDSLDEHLKQLRNYEG